MQRSLAGRAATIGAGIPSGRGCRQCHGYRNIKERYGKGGKREANVPKPCAVMILPGVGKKISPGCATSTYIDWGLGWLAIAMCFVWSQTYYMTFIYIYLTIRYIFIYWYVVLLSFFIIICSYCVVFHFSTLYIFSIQHRYSPSFSQGLDEVNEVRDELHELREAMEDLKGETQLQTCRNG